MNRSAMIVPRVLTAGDNMASMTVHVQVQINDNDWMPGEFEIKYEREVIADSGPHPDKNWSMTDINGHYHAYDQSTDDRALYPGPYPTLRTESRHHECNAPEHDMDLDYHHCEGWDETWYVCTLCEVVITPVKRYDVREVVLSRGISWSASAWGKKIPIGTGPVTMRVVAVDGNQEWFSLATITEVTVNGTETVIKARGYGHLGQRRKS